MSWVIAWGEHLVLSAPAGQQTPETTDAIGEAIKFPTYGAGRAWVEGLWGMDVLEDNSRVFLISVSELVVLRTYRSRRGIRWRMWLKKEWDRSDCQWELRRLRNVFGPEWLHKQRLVR